MDLPIDEVFGVAPVPHVQQFPNVAAFLTAVENLVNYPIFRSQAHLESYQILFSHCTNMDQGKYLNQMGLSSTTLVGAKGIGKSHVLKTFTSHCNIAFPRTYAVYVSFANIMDSILLNNNSLSEVVLVLLTSLGLQFGPVAQHRSTAEHIVHTLRVNNSRLLILVDELDELYKCSNPIGLKSLHGLAYFGNQPSGRVSVVLCGSSSALELLVSGRGDPLIHDAFPLLKVGVPDLNTTKYVTRRLKPCLPTDLATVAILLGLSLDDLNRGFVRLIAFLAGATARSVGRLVTDLVSASGNLIGTCGQRQIQVEALRNEVMVVLLKKNKGLMDRLSSFTGTFVDYAVATVEWETQFEPLTYEEIGVVWRQASDKLINEGLISAHDRLDVNSLLLCLADKGWITIGGVRGGHVSNIYPMTVFQVLELHLEDNDAARTFGNQLIVQVQTGLNAFGARITNPVVIKAALRKAATFTVGGCAWSVAN